MRKIDLNEYDVDVYNDSFGEEETEVIKIEPNKSAATIAVYEWIHSIIAAVAIVVILLTFVFRLINIQGSSMEKTLIGKDKVIITNFMYEPAIGDIVVFPADEDYDEPIIKRIIALEGQEVYINFITNEVFVDGVLLKEDYISSPTITMTGDLELSLTVGEGEVFVLGDNRSVSHDSRAFGCKKADDIIGKAQFVIFPFDHFGYLY